MKHIITLRQTAYVLIRKCKQTALVLAGLLALLSLSACNPVEKSIEDVINEIDSTRRTIETESGAWREELSKLQDTLNALESQVSADTKTLVADTANQVQDLFNQRN